MSYKFILFFLAFLSVFFAFPFSAHAAIIIQRPLYLGLSNGLVGYWSFDGPDMAGDTAYDRSGQGNNGTLTNGPARAMGQIGQALSFDGVDDYVDVPIINLSNTNVVFLSFWMKKDFSTPERVTFELTTDYNNYTDGFLVDANSDTPCNGYFQIALKGNAGYSAGCYIRPSSNIWHHYLAIFNKSLSTDEVDLYIDGILQAPASRPTNYNNSNNFGNRPFYMMSRAGSSYFDSGLIDEVRIYNRALSADEIKRLYNMGR